MDKFLVDCDKVTGWGNFATYCMNLYSQTSLASQVPLIAVMDRVLAEQFGYEFPRVKVKNPKTYPGYLRFRNEGEYLLFVLRWA